MKVLHFADVLLVNMWAKDVGREAGAGKPLLKTIFQARVTRCIHCSDLNNGPETTPEGNLPEAAIIKALGTLLSCDAGACCISVRVPATYNGLCACRSI